MDIVVVKAPITIDAVTKMAAAQFGDIIKATVDVKLQIMALGGELHADEEQLLLNQGSDQENLWGINLYPGRFGSPKFIEFDSMINLRPSQGNMSRDVKDTAIKEQIQKIITKLVVEKK